MDGGGRVEGWKGGGIEEWMEVEGWKGRRTIFLLLRKKGFMGKYMAWEVETEGK